MAQEELFPDKPKEYKVDTFKFAVMSAPIHAVSKAGENYCHLIAKQQEPPFESMKVMGFGGTRELLGQVKVGDVVVLVGNLKDDRGTKTFFAHGLSKPGDEAPKRAFSMVEEGIRFYGSRAELKEAILRDLKSNAKLGLVPLVYPHREKPEIKMVSWVPKRYAVFYRGRWMLKIDFLMDHFGVGIINREIFEITRGIGINQDGSINAPWRGSYLGWLDQRVEGALGQTVPLKPTDPEPEIDFDNLF